MMNDHLFYINIISILDKNIQSYIIIDVNKYINRKRELFMDQLLRDASIGFGILLDKHMKNVMNTYKDNVYSELIEKGYDISKVDDYNIFKHTLFNVYDIDFQVESVFKVLKNSLDNHDANENVKNDLKFMLDALTGLVKVDKLESVQYMDHVANNL